MMEKYQIYKESYVQWIGSIPSHWDCVQFRALFNITKRIAGKTGYDVLAVTQSGLKVKNVESNEGQIASDYSKYQLVDPGDFAMNHMDLLTGFVGISSQIGVTSPDYRVFKNVSRKANSKYYLYIFELCYKQRIFYGLGHGVSNKGRWRLPAPIQNKFYIPLPPLPEQEKIVIFLDGKTSKINDYIVEKEKEIALLAELKESEIARVVTQGLNPDVKKKDSGISWIGMIPEHWEVKRVASLFTGKVKSNSDFFYKHAFKFYYGTLVPKEEPGDIEDYRETYVKYQIIQKDDILINGLNLNYDFVSQRVAIAPSDGIITSAYIVARPRKGTNTNYYNYLFKSMDSKKLFHGMGTGIRLTLSFDELKKQLVVIPPAEEQQAIVDYIDSKCIKITSLISELESEIEYLKEYKQRLIADVVTGQINVQNI